MKKRLGEILLDKGAIAVEELHTGLETCHRTGGRLGTHLLKFGFVDEYALLEALSEQLGTPLVPSSVLRRSPVELRRLLPIHVGRRLQAVVFRRLRDRLCVAMTNPQDPAAIEEIASYTGLEIVTHVATETGVLAVLDDLDEGVVEAAREVKHRGASVTGDDWDRLWTPPQPRPIDLLRARGRASVVNKPLSATFPGLVPVPESGDSAAVEPLGDEAFRSLLHGAVLRDDIGELLLRRAIAVLARCSLFAVHSGRVVGWMARGASVVVEDVQSFSVSLDLPSVFSDLSGADSYCGPMPTGPINDELARILGERPPRQLIVIPVRVKQRAVAFLVGDDPGKDLPESARAELVPAAQKAGVAFEVLIMRKKILA